ncbi:hypothetical protein TraAM80_06524 [Trypanosoma rangeli]|uniref:RRM domain-containing protein n=1 Tax=Trypanosoma rangeli TaxID=5698 RepID=A0A3R7K9N9_TRYRA|nr:uncharacterized protein TraAM80_06524 [Trypanosoma rangeli]RNF02231.1 hypothetical protein TraAM80_06524 [Trypanosoma rangeli]|eukprot:RNF02231.1 hypothetical protein TraAM80_06524 [Trypanosoma rangeli]
MSKSSRVRVDGLTANAAARDVEDLLGYCGKVVNVVVSDDPKGVTGCSAVVEFEYEGSVEVAQLLSGTVFQGNEVRITPLNDEATNQGRPTSPGLDATRTSARKKKRFLRNAVGVAEKIQKYRVISNCRDILGGLCQHVRNADHALIMATMQAQNCTEDNRVVGGEEATTEQWDYTNSQSQWGKKPES